MKEQNILDNTKENGALPIWIKKSRNMLMLAGVIFGLSVVSISQSTNQTGHLVLDDYPEMFGNFLCLISTIIGIIGINFWIRNYRKKEPLASSFSGIMVLHILLLIPSVFGAYYFLVVYVQRYLRALLF